LGKKNPGVPIPLEKASVGKESSGQEILLPP